PSKLDPTSQSKSEHPDFGMIAAKMRGSHPSALPQYVAIPNSLYMTRPTYLGDHYAAFVTGNPAQENYAPPIPKLAGSGNLADRRTLRQQVDRLRRDLSPHLATTDEFRQLAFDMLTSPATAEAFDLSR